MQQQSIIILDCGSQYTRLIARRVRESGVYCEILPASSKASKIIEKQPSGIIISGSPDSTKEQKNPIDDQILMLNLPVLGICFGLQLLLNTSGNKVEQGSSGEYGSMQVTVHRQSKLFANINTSFTAWMSHADKVNEIDESTGYHHIASSTDGAVAAVENQERKIYAVQFHPEVDHTEHGAMLLRNFTHDICQCRGDWQMTHIAEEKIANIRQKLKQDKVLLALSGGVDSSVVAALLQKAVGKQLIAIFVDNGLLRQGEAEQVQDTFENQFAINLIVIDAKDRFFQALKGIDDPEEKRKVIGKTFIDIFEQESAKINDCRWLAQGTIYPDVIESADSNASEKAKVIKSHHNVGGLPKDMKLKLIEPIRDLFKDEVRKLGVTLGLKPELLYRHPFPGPGLGVRVLGEVRAEYVAIVRQADAIFIEQLHKHDLYNTVSQAFAVFLPIKSVGVKGDNRAYEHVVSLRAVQTNDFMTAIAAPLSHTFLAETATMILNRVAGITRVCYDISSKPPATIEWE